MEPDRPKNRDTDQQYAEFLSFFSADCERLHAYIYSLLPHHADADDVFQRCSLLLWKKFDQFDQSRQFLPWACGVAFYEVKNFLRTAQRDRLHFSDELIELLAEDRKSTLSTQAQRISALRRCVAKLTDHQQKIVWKTYSSGKSITEIAEATGRSAQTLYNQLTTIRRKLGECVRIRMAHEREEQ